MSKVLFLDLDGVLVDFVGGALRCHGAHIEPRDIRWNFDRQLNIDPATFWDAFGHNFWRDLDWTVEGRGLLALAESLFGKDNIVLLTSPCVTPGGVEGKVEWIKNNVPEYRRRFFVGPPKHLVAGPGKLLLDDHDDNFNKFVEHGGSAVLLPRPWNRRRDETDAEGRFCMTSLARELTAWLKTVEGD